MRRLAVCHSSLLPLALLLCAAKADHCTFDLQASGEMTESRGAECTTHPDGTIECIGDEGEGGEEHHDEHEDDDTPPDAGEPPNQQGDPDQITVTITGYGPTIMLGESHQFGAFVTGTSEQGVTWTINPVPYALGTVGTINPITGLYQAPMTPPGTSESGDFQFLVVATSIANPLKSSSLLIHVTTFGMHLSPDKDTMYVNESQRIELEFRAEPPENDSYTWSASAGTIKSAADGATYTAPEQAGTYTITASSTVDARVTAEVEITVLADSQIQVAVLPKTTRLVRASADPMVPGDRLRFHANLEGDAAGAGVTWSVSDRDGASVATEVEIDAFGLLTVTRTASLAQPLDVVVTATSVTDTSKSDTATVTLINPAGITVYGTVKYPGARTGTLHVRASGYAEGAVVVHATPDELKSIGGVPFVIRGLRVSAAEADLEISAFLDVLGTGTLNKVVDPSSEDSILNATVTVSTTNGVSLLTLSDPSPPSQPPSPASMTVTAQPFPGGALVRWDPSELAEVSHFEIYVDHASPGPGRENAAFVTVRDGLPPMAMVSGLDELGEYKLSIFTSRDGVRSASGTALVSFTVPASTPTNYSLTGSAAMTGLMAPFNQGRLLLFGHTGSAAPLLVSRGVAGPTDVIPWQIHGFSGPGYRVDAMLDRNGDGEFGPDDLSSYGLSINARDRRAPVSVNANAIYTQGLGLSPERAIIRLLTERRALSATEDQFETTLLVRGNTGRAVAARVLSGPNLSWEGTSPDMPVTLPFPGRPFHWGLADEDDPPSTNVPYVVEVTFEEDGRLVTRTFEVPTPSVPDARPTLAPLPGAVPFTEIVATLVGASTGELLAEPIVLSEPLAYGETVTIELETTGAAGTATFKWKVGNGSETTGVSTTASPATVDLTSANIRLTFAGDFVEGDKFTFEICNEVCISDPTPLVSWNPPVPAPANFHYRLVLTGPEEEEKVFLRGQGDTSMTLPPLAVGDHALRLEAVDAATGNWASDLTHFEIN